MIYVSPTEHSSQIQALGRVASICEDNGCDIIYISPICRVGFQRKTFPDLVASLGDGRLEKELGQISASRILTHAVLIIEGPIDWTTEGKSTIPYITFTRRQFRSVITAIQGRRIILHYSDNINDTVVVINGISAYLSKSRHSSLMRRPNEKSAWGTTTSRSFSRHLLQSFPGIGPDLADRIYARFNRIPLQWTCDEYDLKQIKGIGDEKAHRLIESLNPQTNRT